MYPADFATNPMFLVITLFAKTHLLPNSKSAITNYLDLWHYYGNTPHLKKSRPPHKFCQIPFLSLPPSVREVSHPCDGRRVLIKTNKTLAFCPREQALSFLSCVNSLLLLVIPSLPRNPLERNNIKTRQTAE